MRNVGSREHIGTRALLTIRLRAGMKQNGPKFPRGRRSSESESLYCAGGGGGAGWSCVWGGVVVGSLPGLAGSMPVTTGSVVTTPFAASGKLMP